MTPPMSRQAAQLIEQARDRVRLVLIAGPSSSGKTTATAKISAALQAAGVAVVPSNLDNYFFDSTCTRADESGDSDLKPRKRSICRSSTRTCDLLAGREIAMPIYDFARAPARRAVPMRLGLSEVPLLDTCTGCSIRCRCVADELKFRLYIETILQLRDAAGDCVLDGPAALACMMRDAAHRKHRSRAHGRALAPRAARRAQTHHSTRRSRRRGDQRRAAPRAADPEEASRAPLPALHRDVGIGAAPQRRPWHAPGAHPRRCSKSRWSGERDAVPATGPARVHRRQRVQIALREQ
jgi:uridine kinase